MVDTVEIPLLSERQLASLKTGNKDNVAFDELGNAVWQFAPHEEVELDSGPAPRSLEHPGLSIVEDEPPASSDTIRANVKGLKTGYNPYDSGQLARKAARKQRDMRELSRWIELKRRLDAGK